MININELKQFLPGADNPIQEGNFIFRISLQSEGDSFSINLKIQQRDTKEEHLVKFRFGLEKHNKTQSDVHDPSKPHFEIEIYDRQKAFSATLYFTFDGLSDIVLMNYAKGTVVLIERILERFIEKKELNSDLIEKLVYREAVLLEFQEYEEVLIDALYNSYKNHDLIVRKGNEGFNIRTPHNLKKYLGQVDDLAPLYLPLMDKIKHS